MDPTTLISTVFTVEVVLFTAGPLGRPQCRWFVVGLLHGGAPWDAPVPFRFVGARRGPLGDPSAVLFFCGLALRIIWNVLFARACELIVTELHTRSRFRGCPAVTDDLPSCVAV